MQKVGIRRQKHGQILNGPLVDDLSVPPTPILALFNVLLT
ncbi:hypothetical protein SLEP1_g60235 [Rubroshorea leprosula]|uniref:Uncharacterized protein n=1 Tax=Rubroshorea leprosula TaxID=152421 RepID=A0AAV5MWC1_9ROSI|nr:hypothetical protein SLEP1_g60235 [Rubroshorea leprosula]